MHLVLDRPVLIEVLKDVSSMLAGGFLYPFSDFATPAAQLAERLGYQARVVDFGLFAFTELFNDAREQIARVEELSDAYHLRFRDEDVMVAYLLEVSPARQRAVARPSSRSTSKGHPSP